MAMRFPDTVVPTCPVENCNLAVDIVLKSSDGELFGAHQRNLEIYTEGFPIAGSTVAATSDPVLLEETAEVLRLMLRYTHNMRLPRVDGLPFTLLASLAEAAEKYMVYPAMEVCRMQITQATGDYPNEVFLYSVKHDYPDLADNAAKLTLRNPVSDFLVLIREAGLHDGIALRWLRYHHRWMEALIQLPISPSSDDETYFDPECNCWSHFQFNVFDEVRCNLISLNNVYYIIHEHIDQLGCSKCKKPARSRARSWATEVKEKIGKLPKYSEV